MVDVPGQLLGFDKSCGRAMVCIPMHWCRGCEKDGGVGQAVRGEA